MPLPRSIQSDNEELVNEVNVEWLDLVSTIDAIEDADEHKSALIERACRALWDLWAEEDKREVMGWASWEDLFHPGNEELAHLFTLIEDRIILDSPANQNRFYNLLLIDSDPTYSQLHILQKKHWTPITQFGSRISRLKEGMKEPDSPAKLAKAEEIIKPQPIEEKDGEPLDADFEMKREIGYWRGKQALRLADDSPIVAKLKSRLILIKVYFVLKKGESKILAINDENTTEAATVLLPPSDEDYPDLVEYLYRRFGIKAVS